MNTMKSQFSSGKTSKTKLISYTFLILCVSTVFYFTSCDNITNPQATGDCGASQDLGWSPLINPTNTFVDGGNRRVYQFSAIPNSEITGICTKSKPTAAGSAVWQEDSLRHLSVFLAVRWSIFGPDYPGTTFTQNGNKYEWRASEVIGLQQAFGEGPGTITDLRIDVKFPSTGSALQDSIFFFNRFFVCHIEFHYEDYVASGVMLTPQNVNISNPTTSVESRTFDYAKFELSPEVNSVQGFQLLYPKGIVTGIIPESILENKISSISISAKRIEGFNFKIF